MVVSFCSWLMLSRWCPFYSGMLLRVHMNHDTKKCSVSERQHWTDHPSHTLQIPAHNRVFFLRLDESYLIIAIGTPLVSRTFLSVRASPHLPHFSLRSVFGHATSKLSSSGSRTPESTLRTRIQIQIDFLKISFF